ncbi:MAG: PD-(D/E)XK nuclease family protein [Chloroflexota bacterium]|nr:PD-(D/E)XK nuclease family protein [Chloroflexota bacterium]
MTDDGRPSTVEALSPAMPVDQVSSWTAQIRSMAIEWEEIAERQTRALLADWNEAMSEMRLLHDRLVSAGLWLSGPSDFLDIIGLARHENTHSRMLAWLLRPTARHGLGSGLVRRLMEHCIGELELEPVAVREVAFSVWRNGREADLVVWGRGFTLIIENKVDAQEQDAQCDDLYENFKHEIAPLFIFLTPGGRQPLTATKREAHRAFTALSWPMVRVMLEAALNESRLATALADAGDVVRNYLRTLKEKFG